MVKIKIFRHENRITGYEIKGHAMASKADEFDLVCAGVSSLTISAANGLTGYLGLAPEKLECRDGHILCQLPSFISDIEDLKAQAILETMVLGLQEIARDFPKHVKFV